MGRPVLLVPCVPEVCCRTQFDFLWTLSCTTIRLLNLSVRTHFPRSDNYEHLLLNDWYDYSVSWSSWLQCVRYKRALRAHGPLLPWWPSVVNAEHIWVPWCNAPTYLRRRPMGGVCYSPPLDPDVWLQLILGLLLGTSTGRWTPSFDLQWRPRLHLQLGGRQRLDLSSCLGWPTRIHLGEALRVGVSHTLHCRWLRQKLRKLHLYASLLSWAYGANRPTWDCLRHDHWIHQDKENYRQFERKVRGW